MPARNRPPTDTFARLAKMTNGMLGGISGPTVAETAEIVAA
jgi:hypothetical protein